MLFSSLQFVTFQGILFEISRMRDAELAQQYFMQQPISITDVALVARQSTANIVLASLVGVGASAAVVFASRRIAVLARLNRSYTRKVRRLPRVPAAMALTGAATAFFWTFGEQS
jgi:hypothetical protein